MRVGMDISQLAHIGGVATYTDKLSYELSKSDSLEMVYFYSSLRKSYKGKLKNVKSYKLPPTLFEMLFNKWRNIPIEKFIGSIDIFHSSDWTQPPTKAKKVTTYHDVAAIKYPNWSNPKIVDVNRRRLEIVEKEVDAVIAVSNSTKRDLIEISNIPEEKITVVYEGPTADFKPQSEEKIRAFKKKYNLPNNFLLAIGGVGERKNLNRIKQAARNYNLVITGQTLPWLDLSELELLYAASDALIYCSLYEGFGLPILDAFAVGCPVITSSVSSMPEVGGNAAIFVDPTKVDEIEGRIEDMTNDLNLRKEMINRGLKRVKEFSWNKCTEQTINVYRGLLK